MEPTNQGEAPNAARQKADQVAAKLKEMKLADAAAIVAAGIEETLYYYAFPSEHWRCLRTNNPLERLLREVRRRTRAVGAFPDGKSALMLAAARLRHVAGSKWGTRRCSGMNTLAKNFQTRITPQSMCEKSWTPPPAPARLKKLVSGSTRRATAA